MEKDEDCIKQSVVTKTVTYTKEFVWEIENFIVWWSCRPIAESSRSNTTTWMEEIQDEVPGNWEKSSSSPTIKFEIDSIVHQFRIHVLKFDSWDRFDDDHNLMMGISLFYVGPLEFIRIKPLFYLKCSEKSISNEPIETAEMRKGEHSYARVFSDYSITSNIRELLNPNFQIFCLIQVDCLEDTTFKTSLERNVQEKKHSDKLMLQQFEFTSTGTRIKEFSDFEIICMDKTNDGKEVETKLYCHKIVLYLGSEYYRRMFSGSFQERKGSVKVTDVSSKTMAKVLQYLYTGNISKGDVDVEVMYAADKYGIQHLLAFAELSLGEKLDLETVFETATVANSCGSVVFKDYVNNFLLKHWKQIKCDEQSQVFLNNPSIMKEILDKL